MKAYSTKRFRYVASYEDMQRIYDIARKHSYITLLNKNYSFAGGRAPLREASYVVDGDRYYKITSKYVIEIEEKSGAKRYEDVIEQGCELYPCTWIFDKTGALKYAIHPSVVAKMSAKAYKPADEVNCKNSVFEKDKNGKIIQSAKPILGFNKKFDKTEHKVVCYDLNSAYAAALMDKIIDTYNPRYYDIVKANEVGFFDGDYSLSLRHEGEYADVIFPLIDTPESLKSFMQKYYEQKKTSPKGSKEKEEAKQILVYTVGLWQNRNPYLRAYVVGKCNEFIDRFVKKYKDKVCMWNTDAIYTTERIEELDNLIGEGIGEFKIEYEGLFRQKGLNYQKVDEKSTSYRGVIKSRFGEDYNILFDILPEQHLPYFMDEEYRIQKREEDEAYGESL